MSKVILLYASVHHQNTKKVVDYIAAHFADEMKVVDITKSKSPDIEQAEWVIFASGIYFNTVHKAIENYIGTADLRGKKAVILYTCGIKYRDYAKAAGRQLTQRGAVYMGSCHCRGFDTFGPLEKIGGIAKGHPNSEDMETILQSLNRLMGRN